MTTETETVQIKRYSSAPDQQQRIYRRTLLIVVLSQIFGGAGLAAGITVGALLAQQMLGTDRFAGVPASLLTLGSAGAALVIGRLSQRFGRRNGLAMGFLAGGVGAIGVVIAALTDNILLLFASLLIYGAGTASNLQARYAGTDLANVSQRATAISIAMVSTTFGAVAGPNLVSVMGSFATSIGFPALAGPFILAASAFTLAGLVLLIFLRPDPLLLANAIANAQRAEAQANTGNLTTTPTTIDKLGVTAGATVMVVTQIVMVAIMTMTPVYMGHHGHGLREVGLVISIHIGAMYLPSLVTGVLVDKIGRTFMATAAGVTLLSAGLLVAFAPADSMPLLITALALLGLGWNFGLISGTTLIVDSTQPSNRAKTQGTVDVLVALSGAFGGAISGVIVAQSSYGTLSLAGGFLALMLVPVVLLSRRKRR